MAKSKDKGSNNKKNDMEDNKNKSAEMTNKADFNQKQGNSQNNNSSKQQFK